MIAEPSTVIATVRHAFDELPTGRELRLRDVTIVDDELHVTFAGPARDPNGPYGVRVRIPRDTTDPAWTDWGEETLDEWVHWAVVVAARESYDTRRPVDTQRPFPPGTVMWLELV